MSKQYTIQKFQTASMHYIELGKTELKKLTIDGNKRVKCRLNNTLVIHAAIMNTRDGIYYLMISSKNLKILKLKAGDKVAAILEIDKTEFQFDMPEELAEVLAKDENAAGIFSQLTDGNKRGLMALVNMVKSSNKKIERSLLIAEKLKLGIHSPQKIMKKPR
jgi:uncharacterized protein YdeI (YjbR/CyaY-like superfamily)